MGKLIVIEGSCDGVGKSTQYKLLINRLKDEGKVITDSDLASFSYGAGGGGGGYDGITSGNGGKGQGGFVYIWY